MSLSLFTKNLPEKSKSSNAFSKDLQRIFENKFLEKAKKKNITKPYQFFGIWIAQNLDDYKNISLYIRLAKTQDKSLLEHAVSYVKDYPNARSKQKLFLWFLKGKLKKVEKKPKSKKNKVALFTEKKVSKKKTSIRNKNPENSYNETALTDPVSSNPKSNNSLFKSNESKNFPVSTGNTLSFEDLLKKDMKFSNFDKDTYVTIYKVDYFFKELNLALDIIQQKPKTLSEKIYLRNKSVTLLKKQYKFFTLDKKIVDENPKEAIREILKFLNI